MNFPTVQANEKSEDLRRLLCAAFVCGWASADESHLPAIVEAMARWFKLSSVQVAVVNWKEDLVRRYVYPASASPEPESQPTTELSYYKLERPLSRALTVQLKIDAASFAALPPSDLEALHQVAHLINVALEHTLVHQHDRGALGENFDALSEREWEVCMALEGPDGEKQIAERIAGSPHTLHGHVKNIYRKLRVKSRVEVVYRLKLARQAVRRAAIDSFAAACGFSAPSFGTFEVGKSAAASA
jgi:DNA-binding CsgD family transcriptional regulator